MKTVLIVGNNATQTTTQVLDVDDCKSLDETLNSCVDKERTVSFADDLPYQLGCLRHELVRLRMTFGRGCLLCNSRSCNEEFASH